MSSLHYLSIEGDRTVTWDVEKAATGDVEAAEAVREAERIFEQARKKGATAFVVHPDEPATVIDRFDPNATQIVVVPRVQGG